MAEEHGCLSGAEAFSQNRTNSLKLIGVPLAVYPRMLERGVMLMASVGSVSTREQERMIGLGSLQELVDRAGPDLTNHELLDLVREALGLTNIAYFAQHLPPLTNKGPYIEVTYPQSWIDHYRAMGYVDVDPVLREPMKTILPTDWSTLSRSTPKVRMLFAMLSVSESVIRASRFRFAGPEASSPFSASRWMSLTLNGDSFCAGSYQPSRSSRTITTTGFLNSTASADLRLSFPDGKSTSFAGRPTESPLQTRQLSSRFQRTR